MLTCAIRALSRWKTNYVLLIIFVISAGRNQFNFLQHLYNILTISLQHFYNIFTISLQYLDNIFTITLKYFYNNFTISLQYLYNIFTKYSQAGISTIRENWNLQYRFDTFPHILHCTFYHIPCFTLHFLICYCISHCVSHCN